MQWKQIPLQISKEAVQKMQHNFQALQYHLEGSVKVSNSSFYLKTIQESLSRELQQLKPLGSDNRKEPFVLNLQHTDNEKLNWPWVAASVNDLALLQDAESTYLARSLPEYFDEQAQVKLLPQPLKILSVIAAPAGASRLNYEAEEQLIRDALEPLRMKGLVEITYTWDASLKTLREELDANAYHVLHFTGHSAYNKDSQKAALLMEDDFMQPRHVPATEFAHTIQHAAHPVPLVVLSSCQSAQGQAPGKDESASYAEGLSGLTNLMLQAGVPAVIGMGLSVMDTYAIAFTQRLFERLAGQANLPVAYREAVEYMRSREFEDQKNAVHQQPQALQWLIPALYVSQPVEQVVNWEAETVLEPLTPQRKIPGLEQVEDEDFLFIGRRKETRDALHAFKQGQAVMLTGQGGLGKTTLAGQIFRRLAEREEKLEMFTFKAEDAKPEKIRTRLYERLQELVPDKLQALQNNLKTEDNAPENLETLQLFAYLDLLGQQLTPLFLLDNLEILQDTATHELLSEYQGLLPVLQILTQNENSYTILTTRYALTGLQQTAHVPLQSVNKNDFTQKALHSDLFVLAQFLEKIQGEDSKQAEDYPVTFDEFMELLHEKLGGNYRALEWATQIILDKNEEIPEALKSKDNFLKIFFGDSDLYQQLSNNLLFDQLYAFLSPQEQYALALMGEFAGEITPKALSQQTEESVETVQAHLNTLLDFTLVEQHPRWGTTWYYISPLVKELLTHKSIAAGSFSHEQAGEYYEQISQDYPYTLLLTDAFTHYLKTKRAEKVKELGMELAFWFYNVHAYTYSLTYALQAQEYLQGETNWQLLNRIGQDYNSLGQNDKALQFYEKAKHQAQYQRDKSGEGVSLNNIGQIWKARGDYVTALKYLEDSLNIYRNIGDNSGEAGTLNNISGIYIFRGDYDTALKYSEVSLKIYREIGDKSGEGATLCNIGQISRSSGDYATALDYLEASLKIQREIGDTSGEGRSLNNIGNIYKARGEYTPALEYFEASLKIQRGIGDKYGEGALLSNIGQLYEAYGDYVSALEYFKVSLNIRRDIWDKSGEGTSLNDISRIWKVRGDYATALGYLEASLKIQREIGNKSGEGVTLNNISQIWKVRGEYITAMEYLEASLDISRDIGDKSGIGATLSNIAQILRARGDYTTALGYLKGSLNIIRNIGDKPGEAATLNNISQIYHARGDYASALKYLEASLNITREIGDKSGEGATLNNISQIYDAWGDYATALEYLEVSLKVRREIGDKSSEGMTLNNISQIWKIRREYATALEYLKASLKIQREIGDKFSEGSTLNNISQIYDAYGDYATALDYLETSLKITREIGYKSDEGAILNNIAAIYDARGDYAMALEYLKSSLNIHREIGDKSGEGKTLNNISQIYVALGNYNIALEYLEKALQIQQAIGDRSGEGYSLLNIGKAKIQHFNQPQEGLNALLQAYQISQKVEDAELRYHLNQAFQQLGISNEYIADHFRKQMHIKR